MLHVLLGLLLKTTLRKTPWQWYYQVAGAPKGQVGDAEGAQSKGQMGFILAVEVKFHFLFLGRWVCGSGMGSSSEIPSKMRAKVNPFVLCLHLHDLTCPCTRCDTFCPRVWGSLASLWMVQSPAQRLTTLKEGDNTNGKGLLVRLAAGN